MYITNTKMLYLACIDRLLNTVLFGDDKGRIKVSAQAFQSHVPRDRHTHTHRVYTGKKTEEMQ